MRLTVIMAACLAACSGNDGDETQTETDIPTFGQNTDDPSGVCDDVPEFNFDEMGCTDVTEAFFQIVEAADECEVDEDCMVVDMACETWNEFPCYVYVNKCVGGNVFAEMGAANVGCLGAGIEGCSGCGGARPVECQNNTCLPTYTF